MAVDRLTHKELLAVIVYNPQTGEMGWRKAPSGAAPNPLKGIGSVDRLGRTLVYINSTRYAAHRLAWYYVTKKWPKNSIVPKNGDYGDLRFENLSHETPSEVSRRNVTRRDNTSGAKGVCWDKSRKKWIVIFRDKGRQFNLGRFNSKDEAQLVYDAARAASAKSQIVSDEDVASRRARAAKRARILVAWNRANELSGWFTGWRDVGHFRDTIGDDVKTGMDIIAADAAMPVGPDNWKWSEPLISQFDTSTIEGKRAYERAVKGSNEFILRDRLYRGAFGISVLDYHAMLDAQGHACACCGKPETIIRRGKVLRLAVDHCHSTEKVRGLLCVNCNTGIGSFSDDPQLLRKAAEYLERHASKSDGDASSLTLDKERDAHHGDHSP